MNPNLSFFISDFFFGGGEGEEGEPSFRFIFFETSGKLQSAPGWQDGPLIKNCGLGISTKGLMY